MSKSWTLVLILSLLTACGNGDPSSGSTDKSEQRFPNVIEVQIVEESEGAYRFDVTVSSPYDNPERYADAWRVKGDDGTVYGIRELLHDHSNEQPFTRSLSGVEIPSGVSEVVVEARDLVNGWGGTTMEIELP